MSKKFDEDVVRNAFVQSIKDQSPKVQVRMCMMAFMQVLTRLGHSDEALTELMEMSELMKLVTDMDKQGTGSGTKH